MLAQVAILSGVGKGGHQQHASSFAVAPFVYRLMVAGVDRRPADRRPQLRFPKTPCIAPLVRTTQPSDAEAPELNVLLYGDSRQDAIQRAQSAAREIVLDRIAHGVLPPLATIKRIGWRHERTAGSHKIL